MPDNTSTNWPDPTRPGVPLFPETTLRHAIKKKDSGEIIIRNWKSDGQHWDMIGYSAQWCSETYFYEGPILTPTQITEMLAAERERCAVIADTKRDAVWDGKIGSLAKDKLRTGYAQAAITIGEAIRNLGAAP